MTNNKQIFITLFLLISSIIYFGISDLDTTIQDMFYRFDTHKWLIDKHLQPYEFIFYSGIKKVLLLFAFLFVVTFIFYRKKDFLLPYRKGLIIVILSFIIVPVVTGGIKRYSNMPCPKHEIHYGGIYPKTAVWEFYKPPYNSYDKIKCWPAGHASGGFALMSLFFLFRRKRNRYLALGVGVILGWSMGIYKMAIGDHFFSHTLISMLLAWLLILLIVKGVTHVTE